MSVLAYLFDEPGITTDRDRWSYQNCGAAFRTARVEGVIEEVPSSSTGHFYVRFDCDGLVACVRIKDMAFVSPPPPLTL